jgi:hypothetical protein
MLAIAARVTFSVRREDEKNAGCSGGGTWLTNQMFFCQGN